MLSRSSAVLVCDVKRGFGVDVPDGGLDDMFGRYVVLLLTDKGAGSFVL